MEKEEKNYFWIDLFKAILSNSFTFIDHKSRMIQIDSFEFQFFITCLWKHKSEKNMFLKKEFSN